MAYSVLGEGLLGEHFVENVQAVARVSAFPALSEPRSYGAWESYDPVADFLKPKSPAQKKTLADFQATLRENARTAQNHRDLLCKDLGG